MKRTYSRRHTQRARRNSPASSGSEGEDTQPAPKQRTVKRGKHGKEEAGLNTTKTQLHPSRKAPLERASSTGTLSPRVELDPPTTSLPAQRSRGRPRLAEHPVNLPHTRTEETANANTSFNKRKRDAPPTLTEPIGNRPSSPLTELSSDTDEESAASPAKLRVSPHSYAVSHRTMHRPTPRATPLKRTATPQAPKLSQSSDASRASGSSSVSRRPGLSRSMTLPSPLGSARAHPSEAPAAARSKSGHDRILELFTSFGNGADMSPPAPARPPLGRAGMIGRMLARSRTESSLQKTAPDAAKDEVTVSIPAYLRSPALSAIGTPRSDREQETQSQSQDQAQDDSAPGSPSWHARDGASPARPPHTRHARTYGGASRSFLVTMPSSSRLLAASASADADASPREIDFDTWQAESQAESQRSLWDALDAEDADAAHESYATLRAKFGVDASSDDPPDYALADEVDEDVAEGGGDSQSTLASSSSKSPPKAEKKQKAVKGKGKGKEREHALVPAPRLAPGMMNDLKSITELRSKGESRRFADELGFLLEGLTKTAALSVRRSSALELISKLCDAEFARKAKTADFHYRMWEELRNAGAGEGDKILDILLVVFCALVARNREDVTDLASKTNMVSILFKLTSALSREKDALVLVASETDDAHLKRAGILRAEKMQLRTVLNLIRDKSNLDFVHGAIRMSTCIVGILSILPPKLLPSSAISSIADHLLSEIRLVPARLEAYAAGLPIMSPSADADLPALEDIEHCLRLFDSYLLGRWADKGEDEAANMVWQSSVARRTLVAGLVALCTTASILVSDPEEEDLHETVQDCTDFALRVLVNLSHDSIDWCSTTLADRRALPMIVRAVAGLGSGEEDANELVSPAVQDNHDTRAFDRLCLGLALLTNLVQGTADTKAALLNTQVSLACPISRACVHGDCHCTGHTTALALLTAVYTAHARRSRTPTNDEREDAGTAFIRGHLALLFGLLMRGAPELQASLLNVLPRASPRKQLARLADDARAFVAFYAALAADGEQERGRAGVFGDGDDVAAGALAFLETLRDGC